MNFERKIFAAPTASYVILTYGKCLKPERQFFSQKDSNKRMR